MKYKYTLDMKIPFSLYGALNDLVIELDIPNLSDIWFSKLNMNFSFGVPVSVPIWSPKGIDVLNAGPDILALIHYINDHHKIVSKKRDCLLSVLESRVKNGVLLIRPKAEKCLKVLIDYGDDMWSDKVLLFVKSDSENIVRRLKKDLFEKLNI